MQTFSFKPIDTWFFKQALPHNALAAQELTSLFPPAPRTLIGALRAAIGEQAGVNWPAYRNGEMQQIEQLIGSKDQPLPPGANFTGPWIVKNGTRYYPAPLNWLSKRQNDSYLLTRLAPAEQAIRCDLGNIRLPGTVKAEPGSQPLEGCYIDAQTLTLLTTSLDEQITLEPSAIITAADLFCEEPRLGIARNSQTRRAENGMLYQTRHLRLKEGVWLEMDSDDDWQPTQFEQGMITLGGEARPCHISRSQSSQVLPFPPQPSARGNRITLTLLSPAQFTNLEQPWLPESFRPDNNSCPSSWYGEFKGIGLKLISATLGKAHREGGWDIAKHQSKAVESFIPAGSSYFFETASGDAEKVIKKLHGQSIGNYTEFGRGLVVAGYW